jgi:threonine/homoserine/homoserine lactone efflux protein
MNAIVIWHYSLEWWLQWIGWAIIVYLVWIMIACKRNEMRERRAWRALQEQIRPKTRRNRKNRRRHELS